MGLVSSQATTTIRDHKNNGVPCTNMGSLFHQRLADQVFPTGFPTTHVHVFLKYHVIQILQPKPLYVYTHYTHRPWGVCAHLIY